MNKVACILYSVQLISSQAYLYIPIKLIKSKKNNTLAEVDGHTETNNDQHPENNTSRPWSVLMSGNQSICFCVTTEWKAVIRFCDIQSHSQLSHFTVTNVQ